MGVDTKAILRKGTTIEQIEKVVSEKYTEVEVRVTTMFDFMCISFNDGPDRRTLGISFSNSCEGEYGIGGVWMSLGKWGNSIEILRMLCETFGGYLDEDDCDDEGFYPINYHLYSQGNEFTKLDEFRYKVISKLGYKNIKPAIELFKEYKNLI